MAAVVALGECMVELALDGAGAARVAYAGDTFNTAVYLARLGHSARYATAIGEGDPFSRGMLDLMAAEGIGAGLVVQVPGRVPGLYAIDRDPGGERRFFYWRSEAPVRQYLELADRHALAGAMASADLVFVSGITLAVVGEAGRGRLVELLGLARDAGAAVAFDPNYRARLWESPQAALAAAEAVVPLCAYVSLSGPDAEAMSGRPAAELAARWAGQGAEVVRREDDRSVFVHRGAAVEAMAPRAPLAEVVDTTGAGDSFNAAYLSARLDGAQPREAVAAGRMLAEAVVRLPGAIVPRAAMPGLQA